MEVKHTLVTQSCVHSDALISGHQNLILRSRNQIRRKLLTSEGAVSHNVVNYQPLPITRYKVRFYAYNYFE